MKTQTTNKNITAPILMKIPKRPSDHLLAGSGVLLSRLMIRHINEMRYVASKAKTASDPIALKATIEPMLISDNKAVTTKVIRTALSGIFQPGFTFVILSKVGNIKEGWRAYI